MSADDPRASAEDALRHAWREQRQAERLQRTKVEELAERTLRALDRHERLLHEGHEPSALHRGDIRMLALAAASLVYKNARLDCLQDTYENCPFASVGGLDKRTAMAAPKHIAPEHVEEYLRGYRDEAYWQYGDGWESCTFGWIPALTLPGTAGTEGTGGETP